MHALIENLHEWFSSADDSRQKQYVHALIMDYSKAFDHINPYILMAKVKAMDIPHFLLKWILDFLTGRSQQVKVGDSISEILEVWGTVPQGTKIGVFLFLIMINDLITKAATYKYEDDTNIFSVSKDPESPELQLATDEINDWSQENDMKINAT